MEARAGATSWPPGRPKKLRKSQIIPQVNSCDRRSTLLEASASVLAAREPQLRQFNQRSGPSPADIRTSDGSRWAAGLLCAGGPCRSPERNLNRQEGSCMPASRLRVYHGPEEARTSGGTPATIPLRETVTLPL